MVSDYEWVGMIMPALHRITEYASSIRIEIIKAGTAARYLRSEIASMRNRPAFLTEARYALNKLQSDTEETITELTRLLDAIKGMIRSYDDLTETSKDD